MRMDKEKLKEKGKGLLASFDKLCEQAAKFDIESIEETTVKKKKQQERKDKLKELEEFIKTL